MADIHMPEEQIQDVADAQARVTELKPRGPQLDQPGLNLFFNEGRCQNGWQDKPACENCVTWRPWGRQA